MMVWDDVIGIGMQRLSEEAITNAARRPPPGPVFRVMRFRSLRPRGCRSKHGLLLLSGAMEGKSALTFFYFCLLLLAADSPGGGNFFAGAVLADFTPRPSNLHFPFFPSEFLLLFSPLAV